MNKKENTLEKRSDYVKKVISKSNNTDKTAKILAKELYLSVRTIYRDLVK